MELGIGTILSILSVIFCISTFVLNRRDKAVRDAKESNLELINYRLDKLDENVQKILNKLDTYDNEINCRIEKAMKQHIEFYHKEG